MSKPVRSDEEIGADVERVHGVLSGPGWAETKAAALHDGSRVVERSERADGGVRLVVSRELPAGGPGFLQRFLPRDGRVVQTDDWGPPEDGQRHGTWQVVIPGVPAAARQADVVRQPAPLLGPNLIHAGTLGLAPEASCLDHGIGDGGQSQAAVTQRQPKPAKHHGQVEQAGLNSFRTGNESG